MKVSKNDDRCEYVNLGEGKHQLIIHKVGTWAASISICFSTSTNTWYSTEGHECLATEVVLGDHVVVHQGEAQHRLRQLALLTAARAGET